MQPQAINMLVTPTYHTYHCRDREPHYPCPRATWNAHGNNWRTPTTELVLFHNCMILSKNEQGIIVTVVIESLNTSWVNLWKHTDIWRISGNLVAADQSQCRLCALMWPQLSLLQAGGSISEWRHKRWWHYTMICWWISAVLLSVTGRARLVTASQVSSGDDTSIIYVLTMRSLKLKLQHTL